MRKLTALLLCMALLLSCLPAAAAFSDVTADSWYTEAVEYCQAHALMLGTGADRFAPGAAMTRATFVTVLCRMAQGSAQGAPGFCDVETGSYYEAPVAWAAEQGIVLGVDETYFRPDRPVTREQAACMLDRLLSACGAVLVQWPEPEAPYQDAAAISAYARASVERMRILHLMHGDGACFHPQRAMTRAEGAQLLMNLDKALQNAGVSLPLLAQLTASAPLTEHVLMDAVEGEQTRAAVQAAADFSFALFGQLAGENTVLSPLSALYAMGMAQEGAQGQTLAQLEETFGMDRATLDRLLLALRTRWLDQGAQVSNAMWLSANLAPETEFLRRSATWYRAGIFASDFSAGALRDIDAWARYQTDGMIDHVLDDLPPQTQLILLNALLFEADWQTPYAEDQVRDASFTALDGTTQSVSMMYGSDGFYLEDDGAVGFLKYYKDRNFAFVAILPDEPVTQYARSLDAERFSALLRSAQRPDLLTTGLPKFFMDWRDSLVQPLQALGVRDAFTSAADFGGVTRTAPLHISEVRQICRIEVAEQGTRAAAITVVAEPGSPAAETSRTVILDRPFVYAIIGCQTNLPLFLGTVTSLA